MNKITVIAIALALSVFAMPAATLLVEGEAAPTTAPAAQPVVEVPADQVVEPVPAEPVKDGQIQPTTTEDMAQGPLKSAEKTDRDRALETLRAASSREEVITDTVDSDGYIYRETAFYDEAGGLIVTVIDHHGTANDYNTTFRYADGSSESSYDRFGNKNL